MVRCLGCYFKVPDGSLCETTRQRTGISLPYSLDLAVFPKFFIASLLLQQSKLPTSVADRGWTAGKETCT